MVLASLIQILKYQLHVIRTQHENYWFHIFNITIENNRAGLITNVEVFEGVVVIT